MDADKGTTRDCSLHLRFLSAFIGLHLWQYFLFVFFDFQGDIIVFSFARDLSGDFAIGVRHGRVRAGFEEPFDDGRSPAAGDTMQRRHSAVDNPGKAGIILEPATDEGE